MKVRYFNNKGSIWLDFRMSDGSRKRAPSGCNTLADAELAAPAAIAAYYTKHSRSSIAADPKGSHNGDSSMTLHQAFDKGMRERESWVDSKDRESLRGNFKALTTTSDKLTADMPCSVMNRELMMALRAEWQGQDGLRKGTKTSNSTINHRLVMANTLLDVANLPGHTVKGLTVKNNRRMRRVTEQELQAIITWMMANHKRKGATTMADMILVGLNTTARLSELLAVKWSDVFMDTGVITLRDTKNGDARNATLTDTAKRILERRMGYGGPGPFAGLSDSQTHQLWADAREALGLGADHEFVFHVATRHEGLSRLADAGESQYVIMAYGGHKSIASSSRYVKPAVATLRAAGNAISGMTNRDALQGGTDA